jgi:uncharacterized protein
LTWVFPEAFAPEGLDPITAEFHEYYVPDRGHHPRSIGGFTVTSSMSHIHAGGVRHVEDIAPRPILLVTGDRAHSRWFSDTVHEQAVESSEAVVVPEGATHRSVRPHRPDPVRQARSVLLREPQVARSRQYRIRRPP